MGHDLELCVEDTLWQMHVWGHDDSMTQDHDETGVG